MHATNDQIEKGKGIAAKLKTDVLYINVNGEYFTSENLAQLSVKGDKKKYQKLDYSTSLVSNDEAEELAEIKAMKTVDEVQSILDLELEGAGRESIIEACEARIKELAK